MINFVNITISKYLLYFLCFIFPFPIIAQYNHEIDSLNSLLKNSKTDTTKIKLLLELGVYYEEIDLDTALSYYNNALILAKKTNSRKLEGSCYRNLGDVFYYLNNADESIRNYENSIDIAQQLISKSTNETEIRSLKKGISRTYTNISLAYSDKGEYEKSIEFNTKSKEIKEELLNLSFDSLERKGLLKGISQNYNNFGTTYYYQGLYDKAIENYLKSIKICEKLNEKRGVALCYNNIGSVYSDMDLHQKAIEYKTKSLKIFEELGDRARVSECYLNLGNNFSSLSKFDNAMDCYLRSLAIEKEMNDKRGISMAYINIGELQVLIEKFDEAHQNFLKALSITEELGDKNNQAIVLLDIAKLNLKLGKYNNAIEKGKLALRIAEDIGSLSIQRNVFENLSMASESIGNYKEAYDYHKKFKLFNDSIYNSESGKQIREMEARYQNEKKQKEIELLNKNKELDSIELKRQTTQKYAFIIGFILMLALAFVSYRSYIQKKKDNIILAEQKFQIEEKNEELNQQNEEISAQRDEIEAQRDTVTIQKNQIEKIHYELTDSIRYAKRIQDAVLPLREISRSILGEHFILFKPRNVVSGDFYWFAEKKDWLIITVADCTGHGVPGGFMSMLGVSFLNEIISRPEVDSPAVVLNEMRDKVISSLQQQGVLGEQKDGMDMAVVAINKKTLQLEFAGANNPLYIVKSQRSKVKSEMNELDKLSDFHLEEIKGDKMPIAIHLKMHPFTNKEYQLESGDSIYLFSDGYADQFGGPKGRKFMSAKFKELLVSNASLPMNEQAVVFEKQIENWKNGFSIKYDQTDDITLLGIRI